MRIRYGIITAVLVSVLLPGMTARASWRWRRCEKAKLAITTAYIRCRARVLDEAAQENTVPDFSRCESRFLSKWKNLESSRLCEPTDTVASVKTVSDGAVAEIAGLIIGHLPGGCGDGFVEPGEECDGEER